MFDVLWSYVKELLEKANNIEIVARD